MPPCHAVPGPFTSLLKRHLGVCHVASKDTIALECLAWAVYNNILAPGKSPSLSGYESYGQVLECHVAKMFRGLKVCCLACTSALFKTEERMKSVVMVPQKSPQTKKFPMTRDV